MPVRARDLEREARTLGFEKARHRGSHARWNHPDGRSTTIPVHGGAEIGGWLYHEILPPLGISEREFRELS